MRFLFAALLVLVAFAGCLSDNDPSPDTPDTGLGMSRPLDAPTAAIYHAPPREFGANATFADANVTDLALVPVGGARYLPVSTFEPTLGVDRDGCLFFTHFRGTGTGTRIFMSCDQGASWTEIGPNLPIGQVCFPNSNDPYVHVDRDTGRVFASDLHALISSTLHYTDDKGESWQCNVLGGGLPPGVHDHQTVATGTPRTLPTIGYPNMVYYCVNRVADSVCASSINGGLGFGPFVMVYPGVEAPRDGDLPTLCGGLHGHVETDHAGRVLLPKGQCGDPEVAVSEDDGLTWSRAVVTESTGVQGHEVRVAADQADNLYAFYIGANGLPYLSISIDHGNTWAEPWMVAPPNVTATSFPAVYAGADGNVAVAYIGLMHPMGYETPGDEMAWNAYISVIYDAHDPTPVIATAQMNPSDDPIARGPCGNTRCGGLGDFIDMAIDAEGRPWAAFADMCHGDCVNATATSNAGGTFGFAGTFLQGKSLTTGLPLTALAPTPKPGDA